ncbi:tyrosine-type recombinase/integrase [Bacillus sp. ISL-41]|uniref:tyrosine-type recombinase/integrase n=1 Tax=Bacillus sp. ISL-41 TaxID=2819127 RepID=UPI001BE69B92|nr:tyrosine-type recombinase/integrase [Bacillus sp. ISL-41]MBT2641725.1 tyrosine-type recombinase/integrase [Bacillus sp. ISL-41]
MLFTEGQKLFNKYMITHGMSEETIKGYLKDLRLFNHYMTDVYNTAIYVEDVTADDVEEYMYYLLDERELAPRSRNRYLFSLRSFLNYAVKKRWVEFNAATEVDPVKVMDEKKVALTQEEIEELLSAIEHPIIRFAVALLSFTGLRVKEARTLILSDIDFEQNRLLANGKGKKQRYIPIAQSFKPYLEEYIAEIRESNDSPYLLATKKTGKLSAIYINNELHRAVKELGWDKNVTCHALRRSFATNLLRKGVNVFAISKLLGHASIKTTTVYLQLNENELQEAVNKL